MSDLDALTLLVAPAIGAAQAAATVDLEALVTARRLMLGLDRAAYLARVRSGLTDELPHLAGPFTNGWTWFFRDQGAIDALASELATSARVWVAGCATGEEAYSVALCLAERGIDAQVLGTDVDGPRIQQARSGEYDPSALRRVPAELLARWFERTEAGRYRVAHALRARVDFRVHNLLDAPPSPRVGSWDVVVCRNVLIHLTDEGARTTLQRLWATGARLVLGPTDGVTAARVAAAPPRSSSVHRRLEASSPRSSEDGMLGLGSCDRRREPASAWHAVGVALRQGALEEARSLAEALTRDPAHAADAYLVLGNLAQHAHALPVARAAYDAAEPLTGATAELAYLRGTLARRETDWDGAIGLLRESTRLDPHLWPAWFALAGALERRHGLDAARPALHATARALDARPAIHWRSFVDELEGLSCPHALVRAVCRSPAVDRLRGRSR